MVNFAITVAAALALATGSTAQLVIPCSGAAAGCGAFWVSRGTTNNAQLRDLVFQAKGTRPTAVQADNMVFLCTNGRLVYESLCATGDCISGDGVGGCGHGSIPFP